MLYHEYVLVRRAAGDGRFPPIDTAGDLHELAKGLPLIEDLRLREAMLGVLKEHGWNEETREATDQAAPAPAAPAARRLSERLTPRRLLASAEARLRNRWARLTERQAVTLFLADYLRIRPAHIHGFTFGSNDEAIRYALSCTRRPEAENPYLQVLEPSDVDSTLTDQATAPDGTPRVARRR